MNNTWKKLTTLLISAVLTAGLLASCGGQTEQTQTGAPESGSAQMEETQGAATRIVTDMAGNEVEIPSEVTKYADAWYAHNEVIIMLDQAEGLVATSMNSGSYPWAYLVQPNMNNALSTFGEDFNLEELVALEPDVVFASSSNEDLREQLAAVGIPLLNVMFTDYDQMKQSITLTGEVLGGGAEEMAADYVAYLDGVLADLDEMVSSLPEEEKPTVLHGNSVYSLNIDGSNTIIDAWITAAGGVNAAAEVESNMQTVTLEQVLVWDPDVIITGTKSDVESIINDPEWAGLTAVRNGQVYTNPKGVFSWDRYGVEEALQLQWAANLLHPELFDIDIRAQVKDFYETFLHYTLTDEQVELILNAEPPQE